MISNHIKMFSLCRLSQKFLNRSSDLMISNHHYDPKRALLIPPRHFYYHGDRSSIGVFKTLNKNFANLTSCRSYIYGSGARARSSRLILGKHVRDALANGSPIVALESTVVTHGLPEPQNLELALQLEDEISKGYWWHETADADLSSSKVVGMSLNGPPNRYSGVVVPATIGIVKGQLVIGLSRDEIEYLACRERSRPIKASRRDIPIAMARKLSAGTTVSATMAIASSLPALVQSNELGESSLVSGRKRFGAIRVFATGGMGGVHLDGENSMDISADLYEFARSPIGVVSSGFKSFLDTRRSLEFLETMGATVASLSPSYESTYQANCAGLSENSPSSSKDNLPSNQEQKNDDASNNNSDSGNAQKQLQQLFDPFQPANGHLFPGFFSTINKERVKSPWQCQSIQEAAEILFECLEGPLFKAADGAQQFSWASAWAQGRRAMLLACPIPQRFSLDLEEDLDYKRAMESISSIDKRLDLAGKEKTPMILEQLNNITRGKTLRANMELLRNNARIGAHLAYEYAQLASRGSVGK